MPDDNGRSVVTMPTWMATAVLSGMLAGLGFQVQNQFQLNTNMARLESSVVSEIGAMKQVRDDRHTAIVRRLEQMEQRLDELRGKP